MKTEKIKENRDFRRIYSKGKSIVDRGVVLYFMPTRRHKLRIGFVCAKKIGNAVTRNRAKRVMRAAWRQAEQYAYGSYDLLLVSRAVTPKLKSTQLSAAVYRLLKSAGIIRM